jgi:predicted metal-dependent phosphoesterase TrpH
MKASLLRVELHCHSKFSFDGHIGYSALLATAAKRRLDVVAVTDHDTIAGALEFQRRLVKAGATLRIIVGEERTLADGSHVIGLFLREPLVSLTLPELREEIDSQGGICVIPHPYRAVSGALRERIPDLSGLCFEIFNPTCSWQENSHAKPLGQRGWVPVGGSDAHYRGDLGQCVNLVALDGTPENSVRQALLGRAPLSVVGVPQRAGEGARRHVRPRYRTMIPQPLRPAASKIFRYVLSRFDRPLPELELKHAGTVNVENSRRRYAHQGTSGERD